MIENILKVFLPTVLAFLIGVAMTPRLTKLMYKHKLWKKVSRQEQEDADEISESYKQIHDAETELNTPRVGGVVIWLSVLLTIGIIFILSKVVPSDVSGKLDFLSRSQTLLPLFALLLGGVLGLIEDLLEIMATRQKWVHGLPKRERILIIAAIGLIFGLWFFFKLDMSTVYVPFVGDIELGFGFVVLFIVVMLGTFSSRVIDGIDGLSGGVLASVFASYSIIALLQNQIDLAAFSAVVVGAILVFLWFNVPPARFWMGETGMLGLTLALSLVVFLTDQVLLLLVIGAPLVATSLSSFLQILSKRYRGGKKVFLIAPLHHHFQAKGWPAHKVTMRYWIISIICGFSGVILAIVG